MKIKFIKHPPGGRLEYKAGDVVEFKGKVEEGYARKYMDRGWAEPYDSAAAKIAEKAAQDAAKLEERGKVVIPADLSKVDPAALIELGQSLSDTPVKTKDDALKAIEAEKVRRSPT